jgi:hypothetical protein
MKQAVWFVPKFAWITGIRHRPIYSPIRAVCLKWHRFVKKMKQAVWLATHKLGMKPQNVACHPQNGWLATHKLGMKPQNVDKNIPFFTKKHACLTKTFLFYKKACLFDKNIPFLQKKHEGRCCLKIMACYFFIKIMACYFFIKIMACYFFIKIMAQAGYFLSKIMAFHGPSRLLLSKFMLDLKSRILFLSKSWPKQATFYQKSWPFMAQAGYFYQNSCSI